MALSKEEFDALMRGVEEATEANRIANEHLAQEAISAGLRHDALNARLAESNVDAETRQRLVADLRAIRAALAEIERRIAEFGVKLGPSKGAARVGALRVRRRKSRRKLS